MRAGILVSAALAFGVFGPRLAALDVEAFLNPAKEAHPETWFHLIGGNVSKAGMAADIDAVAGAGISGIQLFHGQFGGPWPGVERQIPCLSADWDELIRFTAEACAARGLSFKMQNCPGWSMSGGPWIAPSNAMRMLSYSRIDVEGGTALHMELPVPRLPESGIKMSDEARDRRDLFVLAFPSPAGDVPRYAEPITETKDDAGGVLRRKYGFAEPVVLRSIELPSPRQMNHDWAYSPDVRLRVNGGRWIEVPQGCWQDAVSFTVALEECPARKDWTLEIVHEHPIKLPFVRFRTGARLHNWEGMAGWVLRGGMSDVPDAPSAGSCVRGEAVLDITERYRGGFLDWTPPEGKWTILRIGHVNNGARNGPAPSEATGWECNKMDRHGIDAHFAAYIGRLAKGPLAGGKLKGFVVDSWECRRQTWTENLEKDFLAARGYAFRKLLPAVFGWIVDSPARTDRFLRDWRQTLDELVERNYYARMSELAREYGMTAQYETAFGDVLPGDLMAFWKHCDTPMCEFWFPRAEAGVGQDDFKPIRPCASAAHIYGKARVAAEAFTTTRLGWFEDLKSLRACANHAFARGVTHLVFHTYTHNPRTDGPPPGSSFGTRIGTPFIRGQTWWRHMPAFTEWAARCGALLEAGQPVNDILWFLGEDIGHKPHERSPFPPGYGYDYVNPDALLGRICVTNGLFATPEGVTWRLLWVPQTNLSDAVRARLDAFAKAGGRIVFGARQGADGRLQPPWEEMLAQSPALETPDVVCGPDANGHVLDGWRRGEQPIDWIHRRDDVADWYFVAANGMDAYSGEVTFRMEGDVSVWDPVTGRCYVPEIPHVEEGRSTVRLDLAPAEGVFVVFSRVPGRQPPRMARWPRAREGETRPLQDWQLSFPADWGAPPSIRLERLASWTELPLGAEGRHFSGTATYRTSFRGTKGRPLLLDLGEVETVAEVFVNGTRVRTLWTPPYACEIGDFVVTGENDLRVDVTSTWFNRLVYDEGQPPASRKTWTIAAPDKASPLRPAGLLGPVFLQERSRP